jgi:hypothetical protein
MQQQQHSLVGEISWDERRLYDRMWYVRMQEAMVLTSESESLCSALASLPNSSHIKLYRHALEHIFSFLSFNELRAAHLVSRAWHNAVMCMISIPKGRVLNPHFIQRHGIPKPTSALARHISEISCHLLSFAHAQQLATSTPYLQELSFTPSDLDDWGVPMRFPSTLQIVNILMSKITTALMNGLITSIAAHSPLVQTLSWYFAKPDFFPEQASFEPLHALHHLRKLSLHHNVQMTEAQVQQLRSLTQLDTMKCSPVTLRQLLHPTLNWTKLQSLTELTDEMASVLPSMLRINQLDCRQFSRLSSLNFLSHMHALSELYCSPNSYEETLRMDALLIALIAPIPTLTSLSIEHSNLTVLQLHSLLSSISTNLQILSLCDMPAIDSLDFLDSVQKTLCSFTLDRCQHYRLSPLHLRILHKLSHLTSFTLSDSLNAPLDELSQSLFSPDADAPISLCPSLKQFWYIPRLEPEEGLEVENGEDWEENEA